jgi:hypothetical protein
MAVNYPVPFYANTRDDTHCFQAALRMVLKYFLPDRDFSWEELDAITAKKIGLSTWPMAGLCWLVAQGFEVLSMQQFDYRQFITDKEDYIRQVYGLEVARQQTMHSDIADEIRWAEKFLTHVTSEKRIPEVKDILHYLDKQYLVIANVNAKAFTNREGYVGHFVVIKGYTNDAFIIHDPGLLPREAVTVSFEQFIKGWESPIAIMKNLIAIKNTNIE